MKAVIPAAGLGTRFLPYTRSQPKEMLPVVDKPAIQYVVEEAVASGIHEILIVTARGKRAIEDHFDRNLELDQQQPTAAVMAAGDIRQLLDEARIYYVRQTERRGLGHAILITERFVSEESFSVLLGDDLTFDRVPCQKALIDVSARKGTSVVAVQHVPKEVMGRYGMVVGEEEEDGLYRVERIVEKPRPNQFASTLATLGRYVLTSGIFKHLRTATPDSKGEVQLTDAIASLLREEDVYAYLFKGRRYDVGDKVGWLRANLELALQRPDLAKDVERLVSENVGERKSQR